MSNPAITILPGVEKFRLPTKAIKRTVRTELATQCLAAGLCDVEWPDEVTVWISEDAVRFDGDDMDFPIEITDRHYGFDATREYMLLLCKGSVAAEMNASTDTAALPAAAATTAGADGDEVFPLSTHLIDWSVLTKIVRVQHAKGGASKIVWPTQLVVRMNASSLQLEDAVTAVSVCALAAASDSDFSWICAYLRLLHRPRSSEYRS